MECTLPYSHLLPSIFSVKKFVRYLPGPLRNRYGITALALIAWVALFDHNDLWSNWKNQRELGRMQEQKEWFAMEIDRTREQLHELNSDQRLLEKFARERYLMKRENEEIFVLVPDKP